MKIKGKIYAIGETIEVSAGLRKRDVIIEYAENPQYPEYLKMECLNDRCNLLDNYFEEDAVEVDFNLKGRKWTDKAGKVVYFNSLHLWKIAGIKQDYEPVAAGGSVVIDKGVPRVDISSTPDDDDLPF